MSESTGPRSVKIDKDERTGWSSERPPGEGRPPRPADYTTRCRVLPPTDAMRYSPGSLLLIASTSAEARRKFVDRLISDRSMVLSLEKVRGLLAGRVGEDELEGRAAELLDAAARKRLEAGETVVIPLETVGAQERVRFVHMAAALRRPRHLILLEAPKTGDAEVEATVNDLRQGVESGSVGSEGIQTAMRLGGPNISELKRIWFRPQPRDDD